MYRRLVLATCCVSMFVVVTDVSVVNVALPAIGRDLHAPVSGLQWTVDAYTLVLASLLMLGGSTGENLATGRSDAGTPAVVVDGWMHSPGHRRNVLRREFVEIGIGIVPRDTSGGDGATYATELAAPPRR